MFSSPMFKSPFRRIYIGTLFFASMLLLAIPAAADESSSVFRVSDDANNSLYLGGTVHLLRQSDYPLPPQYEQAYAQSGIVVLETDIGSMNDMSMQATILQQMTYQDGTTLRDVLNDEAWEALSEYLDGAGLPMAMVQSFKPGLLISTLSVMEFQQLGFTPQGVDMYFYTRANVDAKTIKELEPLQAQLDLMSGMGEGYESEFVLYSLEDFENAADSIEQMVTSWRSGDLQALQTLFVDEMREQAPAVYESMLVRRNHNWMPVIEELFEEDEVAFVLVGAAHLVGDDGLLELLEQRGYEVEQL